MSLPFNLLLPHPQVQLIQIHLFQKKLKCQHQVIPRPFTKAVKRIQQPCNLEVLVWNGLRLFIADDYALGLLCALAKISKFFEKKFFGSTKIFFSKKIIQKTVNESFFSKKTFFKQKILRNNLFLPYCIFFNKKKCFPLHVR